MKSFSSLSSLRPLITDMNHAALNYQGKKEFHENSGAKSGMESINETPSIDSFELSSMAMPATYAMNIHNSKPRTIIDQILTSNNKSNRKDIGFDELSRNTR